MGAFVSVRRFLKKRTLPLMRGRRRLALQRLLEETNLDAKMQEDDAAAAADSPDYRDHLYAAHKALFEDDPEMANKILGILKGVKPDEDKNKQPDEDKKAGLGEEDNLDDKIGEEEDDDEFKPDPRKRAEQNQADYIEWLKAHAGKGGKELVKESRDRRRWARSLKDGSSFLPKTTDHRLVSLQEQVNRLRGIPRNAREFAAMLKR